MCDFDGIDPRFDIEYIAVRNIPIGTLDDLDRNIPQGTILINVKRKQNRRGENSGYCFTVKNTGETYHTMYPWILAENTPSSRKKLKKYHKLWAKRDKLNKIISKKCQELDTLAIRK